VTCHNLEKLKFINLLEIDSTNNYIKKNHDNLKNSYPIAVFSKKQTRGRGRDDRVWYSQSDKGLYCSFGVSIKNINNLNLLSLIIGIAVSEFLSELTGESYNLKWPNDILFEKKKIAGILIENIINGENVISIIGIGVNINNEINDFPNILREKVTSLKMIKNNYYEINKIKKILINHIFKWLEVLEATHIDMIYNKYQELTEVFINKKISFHNKDKIINGIYRGIEKNGGIIIEDDMGQKQTFFSGEII
jgi:BirA family biotin operon repressor/biotin-[acetyl-CoA-carboxylase] ligase